MNERIAQAVRLDYGSWLNLYKELKESNPDARYVRFRHRTGKNEYEEFEISVKGLQEKVAEEALITSSHMKTYPYFQLEITKQSKEVGVDNVMALLARRLREEGLQADYIDTGLKGSKIF